MSEMRFEKTYNGVKTVLEGAELKKLLDAFSGINPDGLGEKWKADKYASFLACVFLAYKRIYPDFEIDPKTWADYSTSDSRKFDLFFNAALYLFQSQRDLTVTRDWNEVFDTKPSIKTHKGREILKGVPGMDLAVIENMDANALNEAAADKLWSQFKSTHCGRAVKRRRRRSKSGGNPTLN